MEEKGKIGSPPPPLLLANRLWVGATVWGIHPMSSAMRTAAIVPRMENAEAQSLDYCNKNTENTSSFPFPELLMAYFHNFPNATP